METENRTVGNGNLKPFVKGVSGNPNGRPKKEFSLTETLNNILSEKDPTTKVERYKLLMEKALSMAMRGDGDMLKYLINRIEGMPKGSETNNNVNIVIPIYGGQSAGAIQEHNSNQEDIQLNEKN